MKSLVLILAGTVFATPAIAADVVYEEPPAPVAVLAAPTWTGFYVGIQGGAAFNSEDPDNLTISSSFGNDTPIFSSANPAVTTTTTINNIFTDAYADAETSFIGGAHVGYDHQIGNLVLGALIDVSGLDVSQKQTALAGGSFFTAERSLDVLATARLRAGYAVTPTILAYATGGLAYGEVDYTFSTDNPAVSGTPREVSTARPAQIVEDEDDFGYTVGGGVDVMVTKNVSLGAEYLYTNLGGNSFTRLNGGPFDGNGRIGQNLDRFTDLSSGDFDFHTITAKLSYRFN